MIGHLLASGVESQEMEAEEGPRVGMMRRRIGAGGGR